MGTQKKYFSNNAESNLIDTFKILRQKSSMFDVTLGCFDAESGKMNYLPAHKVLLAAYSPVFTAICAESMQQSLTQPFIHLVGISHFDLFHLLNFMYDGEVDLPVDEINSFLTAAKQLQIMGIAEAQGFEAEDLKLEPTEVNLEACDNQMSNYKPDISEDQDVFVQPYLESEQENMAEQEQPCSEYSEMDVRSGQSSPVSSKCLLGGIRPLPIENDYPYNNLKLEEQINSQFDEPRTDSDSFIFDEQGSSSLGNQSFSIKRKCTPIKKGSSLKITKTPEGWQCNTCMYTTEHKHTVRDHALRKHSAPQHIACHYCQKICRDKVKFRHHLRNCSKRNELEQNA